MTEPAGPEELIERALTITDDRMGGYHATKWRQREAIEALAAAGLLADPEQGSELESDWVRLAQVLGIGDSEPLPSREEAIKAAARLYLEREQAQNQFLDHYNATSGHLDRIRELETALRERTRERDQLLKQFHDMRGIAVERQGRIEAAIALCADYRFPDDIRIALQPDAPPEPPLDLERDLDAPSPVALPGDETPQPEEDQ